MTSCDWSVALGWGRGAAGLLRAGGSRMLGLEEKASGRGGRGRGGGRARGAGAGGRKGQEGRGRGLAGGKPLEALFSSCCERASPKVGHFTSYLYYYPANALFGGEPSTRFPSHGSSRHEE